METTKEFEARKAAEKKAADDKAGTSRSTSDRYDNDDKGRSTSDRYDTNRKTESEHRSDVEKDRDADKSRAQMDERWDSEKKTAVSMANSNRRSSSGETADDRRAKEEHDEEERKAWAFGDEVDYRYFRTTTEPELHGYNPDDPKYGLGREDLKLLTNWRGQQFTEEEWDGGKETTKKLASNAPERPVSTKYVTRAQHDAEGARLVEEMRVLKQRLWEHRNPSFEEFDEDGDLIVDQTGSPTPKAMKKRADAAKTEAEAKKSGRSSDRYEDRTPADKDLTKAEWEAKNKSNPKAKAFPSRWEDRNPEDKDLTKEEWDTKYRDNKGRTYPGDGRVDDRGRVHPQK